MNVPKLKGNLGLQERRHKSTTKANVSVCSLYLLVATVLEGFLLGFHP